jgi:L-2-hydroxyglutarate oxidase LhgO
MMVGRVCISALQGVAALVNLFGIESPGLNSSLAIAEYVTHMMQNK